MEGVSEKTPSSHTVWWRESGSAQNHCLSLRNSPRDTYRKNSPQATSICCLEWQWSEVPVLGSGWKTVTMETGPPKAPDQEHGFSAVLCRWSHSKDFVTVVWHSYTTSDCPTSAVHKSPSQCYWHFGVCCCHQITYQGGTTNMLYATYSMEAICWLK